MLRFTITFIFTILISFASIAQGTFTTAEDSDPEATKILDALKVKYQESDNVSVDFSLNIEFPGEGVEKQKGAILQQDDKFVLDMAEQSIYCNGEIIWVYLKEMNEVQINDAEFDEESMFLSPNEIFNLYNSGKYAYGITFKEEEEGDQITQIEFKPLDSDSEYSKMRLTLKNNDTEMKRLKVFGKDGSRYTMKINKMEFDKDIDSQAFEFDVDQFPDITVEDLRL